MIPAADWNELLARRRKNRIVSISERRLAGWRHPWFTTCTWYPEEERWQAVIKPGFVFNGRECDVVVSVAEGADLGPSEKSGVTDPGYIDVPLTDSPEIPLTEFRALGTDDIAFGEGSAEKVPAYFTSRGVLDGRRITTDLLEASGAAALDDTTLENAAAARLLRACDVAVYHDRAATTVDWTLGTGLEGTFAQFVVGSVVSPTARSGAYLRVSREFIPITEPPLQERLAGDYQEPTYDALKVCTIYLLSPEGAALGSEPDGTWTPHVRYDLHWNLAYYVRGVQPGQPSQNLEVDLAGLANVSGAQLTINQMLAENNDAFAAASQFFTARAAAGRFWSV